MNTLMDVDQRQSNRSKTNQMHTNVCTGLLIRRKSCGDSTAKWIPRDPARETCLVATDFLRFPGNEHNGDAPDQVDRVPVPELGT